MNAEPLTIEQLQDAVEKLPPEKRALFRRWFEEFAGNEWDQQIEQDIKAGKWDALADAALAEHKDGQTRKL